MTMPSTKDLYLALLYHASLLSGSPTIRVRNIFQMYSCPFTPEKFLFFLGDVRNKAFVNIFGDVTNPLASEVELLPRGIEYIEEEIGENVAAFLEENGIRHILMDLAEDYQADSTDIDSSKWTGLTLSSAQLDELILNIDQAIARLDTVDLSQFKKSQARALLLGARALAEAPEPPLDIIAKLFGNIDRLLGIAGLFVGVAGLIVSVGT